MIIASKLGVGPPKKFCHEIGIPSSNSRWLRHPELESLQVLSEERCDRFMDQDPFYGFGDKESNAINNKHRCQVYSGQHTVHADLEKITPPKGSYFDCPVSYQAKASSYRLSDSVQPPADRLFAPF